MPQLLLPPTQPLSSSPALPTPRPPRVLAPSIFLQGRGATLSSPLTPPWGEATVGGWVCHFRLCGLHSACGPAGWPNSPTLGRCNTGILLELSYHSSHATEGQTSLSCPLATGEKALVSPDLEVSHSDGLLGPCSGKACVTPASSGGCHWQWLLLASLQVPSSHCVPGLRSIEKRL